MEKLYQKLKNAAKPVMYVSMLTMALGLGSISPAEASHNKNYFDNWGFVDKIRSGHALTHVDIILGDLDGDGDLDVAVIFKDHEYKTVIKIYENRIPQKK